MPLDSAGGDKVPETLPAAPVSTRKPRVLHFIMTLHPLVLKPSWLVILSEVLGPPTWQPSVTTGDAPPVLLKDQDYLEFLHLGISLFCTGIDALTSL